MKYLFSFKQFVNESLKRASLINDEDVRDTILDIQEKILPLLRLSENDIAFIGSAGKKGLSQKSFNINIGINSISLVEQNSIEYDDIFSFLKEQIRRLKYDSSIDEDKNRFIINWPIKGDEVNGIVEVHLQMSKNLDWLKFSRYSPNLNENESEFTGKHREYLLKCITDKIHRKVISYFKSDLVKEYEVYELDLDEGLTKVHYSFEGKHGILKNPIVLEKTRRLITDVPDEFVQELFGENYQSKDLATFEQCWEAFNSSDFLYPKKRERIKRSFKNLLVSNQLTIPNELM